MPIFDYQLVDGAGDGIGCDYCRHGFEHLERLHAEPLSQCPRCAAPIQRLIGAPAVAMGGAHLQKEKKIGEAGFTQYRKIGKGVYEKRAGKGPAIISDG